MDRMIAIAGPTASGKTDLSVRLAKSIDAEIISADAMQMYRQLDIGTAKITEHEKCGIMHYMIDEYMPDEDITIYGFTLKAIRYIDEIRSKGKTPIITGGSGLYLDSILYESYVFQENEIDAGYRKELYRIAEAEGADRLFEMLQQIDPDYAALTHPNNVKRVVRALEFFYASGTRKSESEKEKVFRYQNTYYFGLYVERAILYDRINRRVDQMIERGLVDEVRNLLKSGYHTKLNSMQAIGYREIASALQGEIDMATAIEKIKQYSRNYAKRQYTWFNKNKDIIWIDTEKYQNTDEIIHFMRGIINENQL